MYDDCDYEEIHMLENSNLCFEDLVAYSKAISSIEVYDNISFADTGEDCPEALIASVSVCSPVFTTLMAQAAADVLSAMLAVILLFHNKGILGK